MKTKCDRASHDIIKPLINTRHHSDTILNARLPIKSFRSSRRPETQTHAETVEGGDNQHYQGGTKLHRSSEEGEPICSLGSNLFIFFFVFSIWLGACKQQDLCVKTGKSQKSLTPKKQQQEKQTKNSYPFVCLMEKKAMSIISLPPSVCLSI